MDAINKEFWGDLQVDLYTENTAVYLANSRLETLISQNGRKAHRPILNHPDIGTYVPHTDIAFDTTSAEDQTLEVDTFKYAAADIDDTEKAQTPYGLTDRASKSIRGGLMNAVEQKFLSEIVNAAHTISGGVISVQSSNILDIIEEAEGDLGAFDAPYATDMRAFVAGPRTVAKLRRAKSDRESRLGDSVLENGVVGPWQGWTVVQNNNLPWKATLNIATNPTNGDTVTIDGVVFEFQSTLSNAAAGHVAVLRDGSTVATSRAALAAAINDSGTAGTTYTQLKNMQSFLLRRKRTLVATSAQAMAFTGFGDISVSSSLTATADGWTAQEEQAVFMIRGAIDMVLQLMELEVTRKEKGFADLPKGLIGVGTKAFDDGANLMVRLRVDASNF